MKILTFALLVTIGLTSPAQAASDAVAGEKAFEKNCRSCHAIIADDGTVIQKGGKLGPNLYGVIGRPVASLSDFIYSDSIRAAGALGLIWDETTLTAYVADPTKWLAENSGDAAAKSKMTFKLAKGGEDVAAYLASLKPAP